MKTDEDKIEIRKILTRLSLLMIEQERSYSWLARQLNIPPSTVGCWFSREVCPSVVYLNRIASIMGVSLDYLVNGGQINGFKS